jgi:hypothetical protein
MIAFVTHNWLLILVILLTILFVLRTLIMAYYGARQPGLAWDPKKEPNDTRPAGSGRR